MKKYRISFVLMFQILLLSLGVGVLSFCSFSDVSSVAASDQAVASSTELKSTKPESLSELQNASEAQLEAWTGLNKFDGREYDYVTPQRQQGGYPVCWAFAATGLAEVSILREGFATGYNKDNLDFDDLHVAWASKNMNKSSNQLNLMKDDVFGDIDWNEGDAVYTALYSMTDGFSPIPQQTQNEYKINRESEFIAEQVIHVDPKPEAIKKAIIEYGGVAFSYRADTYMGYMCTRNAGTDHASVIVGWDDNLSKDNEFMPHKPKKDGAWIVKNSWGEEGGADEVNGIHAYYLSYESTVGYFYTVDMGFKNDYPNIYQYDGCSVSDHSAFSDIEAHAAIYEAKLSDPTKQEYLKAIQVGFNAKDVNLQIEIYKLKDVNPANVNDEINDPTNGEKIHRENVYFAEDGFYIIDLNTEIPLEQGEYFSIVLYDISRKDLKVICGVDVSSVNDMTYYCLNGKWKSHKDGEAFLYANQSNNQRTARIRAITITKNRTKKVAENDLRFARIEFDTRLFYYRKNTHQNPTITVSIGDKTLIENTDYKVAIEENNITPGKVGVTIKGIGSYVGTRTSVFEIAKLYSPENLPERERTVYQNVNSLRQVLLPTGWTWLDANTKLQLGKYAYTAKYIGEDADCYINTMYDVYVTKLDSEPPVRQDISDARIDISGEYIYTGSPIIPNVTVLLGDTVLINEVDFTIECSNNINAGTATVTITGIGLYKDEKSQEFTINKAIQPQNMPQAALQVSRKIKKLSEIQNFLPYGWSWQNGDTPINDDTTTAIAEYKDKTNYVNYAQSVTITRADKINIETLQITIVQSTEFIYNGDQISPDVKILDGIYSLQKEEDFTVTYQNNINAGKGEIIVSGCGDYYQGTKTVRFTINKAEKPKEVPQTINVSTNAKTLGDIQLPTDWRWENPNLAINEDMTTATIVRIDANNYVQSKFEIELNFESAPEQPVDKPIDSRVLWWGLGIGGGITVIGIVSWLISRRKKK